MNIIKRLFIRKKPEPVIQEPVYVDERLSVLRNSDWFDAEWYLQTYPDVADAGMDAAEHYLNFGAAEGRQPGPSTDGEALVQSVDMRALLRVSEWFDSEWYLQHYPDVADAGFDAADHYLNFGAAEGRLPGPVFDEGYYLSQLREPFAQASGLLHYLVEGQKAGLKPVRDSASVPWWWQVILPLPAAVNLKTLLALTIQPLPVVVIPVFNAVDSLADCLASLSEYRHGIAKVIIIDDASTDSRACSLLDAYPDDAFFECYRNEENLGFSGTVNRGFQLGAGADVILLNSDTKVTRGFAVRLRLAAYSNEKVASVTPLSNNAGAFSVPSSGKNDVPAQFGLARFALAITQLAVGAPLPVPTGHGFCMYLRRAALDDVGLFDALAFPRGYGEENDFCRRSAARGWQHLIDPRTYIFHQGSASFTHQRSSLMAAGIAVLQQRYPDYPELISESFGAENMQRVRQRINSMSLMPLRHVQQIKLRVLYVISTVTGGTPKTNQDLMQALAGIYECFVFRCDSKKLTLKYFMNGIYTELAEHELSEPVNALPHTSDEYDQVIASWLVQWSIDLVHVRHLGWHSLGLVTVAKALGINVIHSFHDFYTLCPNVKLLDNNLRYCAATCTQGEGSCAYELWPEGTFPRLKHHQIHEWQALFAQTLQACDAFVTTNAPAKALFLKRYPELAKKPFEVIAHGRDFGYFDQMAVKPEAGEKLRMLCAGNIGEAKGLRLIQQLALRRPDIEVHILGIITDNFLLPDNVIVHGSYVREQFFRRVAQIKPHFGAILSICPETWCHALTEMWAAGIPVVGVDIGAVGERIRKTGAGWLLTNNSVASLEDIVNTLAQPAEWESKFLAVKEWQMHEGKLQTCDEMARAYNELYKSFIGTL